MLNLSWDGVKEMDWENLFTAIEQKEKAAQRHKMWVIAGVTGLVALVAFGVMSNDLSGLKNHRGKRG